MGDDSLVAVDGQAESGLEEEEGDGVLVGGDQESEDGDSSDGETVRYAPIRLRGAIFGCVRLSLHLRAAVW